MDIIIKPFDASKDYKKLLDIIQSEGDEWKDYLVPAYKTVLEKSITYIAYADGVLCGYVRSIDDFGLYIWIIDLLVDKRFRGHSIGKLLMSRVVENFPNHDVYVLSDVDEYYLKQGYSKEGSVFKIE